MYLLFITYFRESGVYPIKTCKTCLARYVAHVSVQIIVAPFNWAAFAYLAGKLFRASCIKSSPQSNKTTPRTTTTKDGTQIFISLV